MHPDRLTCAVMPYTRRFFDADEALQQRWYELFRHRPDSLRLILSAADVAEPRAAEVLATYLDAGYQIRMMPRLPSWFRVIEGMVTGMPLEWGEPWPTSATLLRGQSVLSLLQAQARRGDGALRGRRPSRARRGLGGRSRGAHSRGIAPRRYDLSECRTKGRQWPTDSFPGPKRRS